MWGRERERENEAPKSQARVEKGIMVGKKKENTFFFSLLSLFINSDEIFVIETHHRSQR